VGRILKRAFPVACAALLLSALTVTTAYLPSGTIGHRIAKAPAAAVNECSLCDAPDAIAIRTEPALAPPAVLTQPSFRSDHPQPRRSPRSSLSNRAPPAP
jgi:hypothetical protein